MINSNCDWKHKTKYIEPVDQQLRRSSVQVQSATLPKLPSTESLSTSVNFATAAPPLSPGINTKLC